MVCTLRTFSSTKQLQEEGEGKGVLNCSSLRDGGGNGEDGVTLEQPHLLLLALLLLPQRAAKITTSNVNGHAN